MQKTFLQKSLLYLFIGYLIFFYFMFFFVDIFNVFNSQRILYWWMEQGTSLRHQVPLFWFTASVQGSFTENLQWFFLIIAFVTSLLVAIHFKKQQAKYFVPSVLWSIGMFLLVLEDIYNTRHKLRNLLAPLLGADDDLRSYVAIGIEVVTYGLMGVLMISALYLLRKVLLSNRLVLRYFVIGYGAYAIASAFSSTRHFMNWYRHTGNFILRVFRFDTLPNWIDGSEAILTRETLSGHNRGRTLGYYFMDYLVEETFELIGAACLALGFVALLTYLKHQAKQKPTTEL